jgi:transcriptional regulator with XRE-family HTH domain
MSGILTGTELREIRKGLGLSQQTLAELCGVTRGTASDWEREKFDVPLLVSRVMRMLAAEPPAIYKLWPEAKPLIAPKATERQAEEDAAPAEGPRQISMLERWAEDDGAGVLVIRPDGTEVILGAGKREPEPSDAGRAKAEKPEETRGPRPTEALKTSLEAGGSDEIAKRAEAKIKKMWAKHDKRRK